MRKKKQRASANQRPVSKRIDPGKAVTSSLSSGIRKCERYTGRALSLPPLSQNDKKIQNAIKDFKNSAGLAAEPRQGLAHGNGSALFCAVYVYSTYAGWQNHRCIDRVCCG